MFGDIESQSNNESNGQENEKWSGIPDYVGVQWLDGKHLARPHAHVPRELW